MNKTPKSVVDESVLNSSLIDVHNLELQPDNEIVLNLIQPEMFVKDP